MKAEEFLKIKGFNTGFYYKDTLIELLSEYAEQESREAFNAGRDTWSSWIKDFDTWWESKQEENK